MPTIQEQYILQSDSVAIIEAFAFTHSAIAPTDTRLDDTLLLASAAPFAELAHTDRENILLRLPDGEINGKATTSTTPYRFRPAQFAVPQPAKNESGKQELEVHFPLTTAELDSILDAVNVRFEMVMEAVKATYLMFLSSNLDAGPKHPTPLPLRVIKVSKSDTAMSVTLGRVLNAERKIPRTVYNPLNSPGLVR